MKKPDRRRMARVSRMRARLSTTDPSRRPCRSSNLLPDSASVSTLRNQNEGHRWRPWPISHHARRQPPAARRSEEMMWAREDGIPVDTAALEERVRLAVDEVVARQTKSRDRHRQRRRMGKAELRHLHQGPTERFWWDRHHDLRVSGHRGAAANEGPCGCRPGTQTPQGARVQCADHRARHGSAAHGCRAGSRRR